mgnify:CR=1 FL=1
MIYNSRVNWALKVAYGAHMGQKDRAGVPYIFHPYHLAEQMDTDDEIIVALLHDIIEDTDLSLNDLIKLDDAEVFTPEIIEALQFLTHRKDAHYSDYIYRIRKNDLATKVKLADLKHNSDMTRLKKIKESDLKRNKKYSLAIKALETDSDKSALLILKKMDDFEDSGKII